MRKLRTPEAKAIAWWHLEKMANQTLQLRDWFLQNDPDARECYDALNKLAHDIDLLREKMLS